MAGFGTGAKFLVRYIRTLLKAIFNFHLLSIQGRRRLPTNFALHLTEQPYPPVRQPHMPSKRCPGGFFAYRSDVGAKFAHTQRPFSPFFLHFSHIFVCPPHFFLRFGSLLAINVHILTMWMQVVFVICCTCFFSSWFQPPCIFVYCCTSNVFLCIGDETSTYRPSL